MINYITKLIHSLTQSHMPVTLTSLLSQPPGLLSIENGALGTEKLLLKTQVSEDFG